ncbi:hypothetical protein Droror1_Dr00019004 [Drosera rotundifolia]
MRNMQLREIRHRGTIWTQHLVGMRKTRERRRRMMQSFKPHNSDMYSQSSFYLRGVDGSRSSSRFLDIGELEHSLVFHQQDGGIYNNMKPNNVAVSSSLNFGAMNGNMHIGSATVGVNVDAGVLPPLVPSSIVGSAVAGNNNGHLDNWGESAMADTSQQTDTSTDVDTEDKNQCGGINHGTIMGDSTDQSKEKAGDQKTLRRLAQNREAARKSRLRKKAYVQQLENSRLKLTQLEQELERARQQGIFIAGGISGEQGGQSVCGAVAFDVSYTRWLDDHQRLINDLRTALDSHMPDDELRVHVDSVMSHHDELFRLKSIAAKADIFHMLTGTWKSPVERFFMWLGGFRSSEVLKILVTHLEPITDHQLVCICNLQQSSQQAEDALSQGIEALQISLVDTLSSDGLGPSGSSNVADYMTQMAVAMGKLATLENFVHQADILRQQTLQRMNRILTTRQAARALLVIHDYKTRLCALSSLWLARPKNP